MFVNSTRWKYVHSTCVSAQRDHATDKAKATTNKPWRTWARIADCACVLMRVSLLGCCNLQYRSKIRNHYFETKSFNWEKKKKKNERFRSEFLIRKKISGILEVDCRRESVKRRYWIKRFINSNLQKWKLQRRKSMFRKKKIF